MDCPICQDGLTGRKVISLVCTDAIAFHTLCQECFEAHFEQANTCPFCRVAYSPEDIADMRSGLAVTPKEVVYVRDQATPFVAPIRHQDYDEYDIQQLLLQEEFYLQERRRVTTDVFNNIVQTINAGLPCDGREIHLLEADLDQMLLYSLIRKTIKRWRRQEKLVTSRQERKPLQRKIVALSLLGDFLATDSR